LDIKAPRITSVAALATAAVLGACSSTQGGDGSISANDIGGMVTGAHGPEAGV
jgi:hypothetical protein